MKYEYLREYTCTSHVHFLIKTDVSVLFKDATRIISTFDERKLSTQQEWNDTDRKKTEILGGKNPVVVSLSPPNISHKLNRDRNLTEVSEINAINNFRQ